jgi:5-methyltetrahydrofolate--homocysteine methyltransferase
MHKEYVPPMIPRPPWNLDERCRAFPLLSAARERVLVFDGAMGTMIQASALSPDDFAGKDGCNEILVATRPDVIRHIHASYLDAGADVVETDTFGSTPLVLAEYGIADRAYELSKTAARVAREVVDGFSTQGRPRFVSGSVGPGTRLVSLGHVSFDDLRRSFETQIRGLLDGGVDVVQIETCQDLLQAKAAVLAAREAMRGTGRDVPIIVQVTVETTGTLLMGTETAAVLAALEALDVDVIGLNCAVGPDLLQEHVRLLGQTAAPMVSVLPNAGLPRNVDGKATYDLTPADLARYQRTFVVEFGATMVGGCCGTTPAHIRAVVEATRDLVPRPRPAAQPAQVASLYVSVPLAQQPAPLIVGERTNANGSKKFRDLLLAEDWDGMVELGRDQAKEGAHVIDVCTAFVGRDEARDMTEVLRRFATSVTSPIMIDTTQVDVLEAALKLLGGRALVNSVNLEDGEGKADRVVSLAREYGAALVALTIDEEGMAKTAERKLAVARRLYDLATRRHGLPGSALLFDPLTFTIGSGDEASRDAGRQTLEAIRLIKRELPGAHTLLGLSNISFGLAPFPRQILNSVFLAEAIEHGLDAAILNAAKILPLHKLEAAEVDLVRDLIYDRRRPDYDPLFAFMERFAGAKGPARAAAETAETDAERALVQRIIDGRKAGLDKLLDRALETREPVAIINEVLLEGMKTVGDLFGSGQMQLPFVLQAAETMKAAVAYLEKFMTRAAGAEKGTLVLATVKGDVHDIGKNLVDIILSNNGYRVVNLGIKQPIDAILDAAEREKADAIGMSGLLVKSTVVMKENLEHMSGRGLSIPVICGGAALNRRYVDGALSDAYRTADVYYGADAFSGLKLMEEICGHAPGRVLTGPGRKRVARGAAAGAEGREEVETRLREALGFVAPAGVKPALRVPAPPFLGTRIVGPGELPLHDILPYINRRALFRGQWQYRRGRRSEDEYRLFLAQVVEPTFHQWCRRAADERLLEPKLVYGYFACNSDGNDLIVYDPQSGRERLRFTFPRQRDGKHLCISSFFLPVESGERDVVAFHLVTMGAVATETAQGFFKADRYAEYLHFHGLAVEAAEALAEYWHMRIRSELGIGGQDAFTVEAFFHQAYQGSRYSFGYPACPRLEDQAQLFDLLDPARIGLSLTDEFQLVPEQSTSAIIVHHPEARYFHA